MYVYILKTERIPTKYYTGITSNLKERLTEHNSGKCKATAPYRPWKYNNFFWFRDSAKAFEFERYLKSGSGRSFSHMHF